MKHILSLKFEEAKAFLLKNDSYINVDLPPYIKFDDLLNKLSNSVLSKTNFLAIKTKNPDKLENVNYKLLHNKNGKYDWRPFEFIHPVLYVSLAHEITKYKNWKCIKKRFGEIRAKSAVECVSLPVVSKTQKSDKAEQILNWWEQIEQKSLELSLDFSYIYHTDITDCYGSIYTHSIPWAIHTKKIAKDNQDKKLIGNMIDFHIRSMSYGQTNGIPQGSVLMDFIAEIVLAYADLELSQKIKHINKDSYKIIRYRDDYRIFVNSPQIADEIIKNLTETLIELGLKLHSQKTTHSNNVIQSSIKSDKIAWLMNTKGVTTIQKRLLILHKFALDYPNSGTLTKELQLILKKIHNKHDLQKRENIPVLISIVVDIAFLNPRTYSVSIAILSTLLNLLEKHQIDKTVKRIISKFKTIPNTGHMQIWLQRAIIKLDIADNYFDEPVCKLVEGNNIKLWNNEWLHKNTIAIFNSNGIIKQDVIDNMDVCIQDDEVLLFGVY